MEKGNVRGNITFAPLRNLQIQWNTGYSRALTQKTPTGGTAKGVTLNAFRRDRNYFNDKNPDVISQVLEFDLRSYVDHLVTGVTATFSPFSRMTNRLTAGYDLAGQETRGLEPFGYVLTPTGEIHDTRWQSRTLTFDYVGSYGFDLSETLRSTFSWGGQSITTEETKNSAFGQNFPGPGEPTVSSASISLGFEERIRVVNAGFFFQNVFDFRDRYFLTAGIRFDGNSAFGEDLGIQAYPKVSASYIISDETFWNDDLGTLKLRAAYGHSGRAPGAFDAVRTWEPSRLGDAVAFLPNNLGNADLGPERTSEIEVGFEGAFLNDRLTLDFTYYNQKTTDALFGVRQIPTNGGWSSQLKNVGEIKNTGIELSATGRLIQTADYSWELGGMVSTNNSETVDLGGAAPFSLGNRGYIVEGQPVPVMRVDCVTNPDELADPIIKRDCNLGPNRPTLTLGFNSNVRLPLGVTVSARGEYQGGAYAYSLMDGESITRGIRWPACFNSYPDLDAGNVSALTARERAMCIASNADRDFAVFPLDFFRMRDVTVMAPIPTRWVPGEIASATLSLSAQNFFTWKEAADSYLDPETTGGFWTEEYVGMNARVHQVGGSIPIPATFVASLRFVF
jgi:outer membrane receptor protein involved in Fe transport